MIKYLLFIFLAFSCSCFSQVPSTQQGTVTFNPEKLYKISGVNLNAGALVDIGSVSIDFSSYIITDIYVLNPSGANLSLSTIGIYSSPNGAGQNFVAPVALINLTAANKIQKLTLLSLTDLPSSGTIYVRLTIAAGIAGTADIVFRVLQL